MALKEVTGGEKPERKIIISMIEMKKELIAKWESFIRPGCSMWHG
jgi:hypothetical protein